jgi:hypothetical protein
MAMKTKKKRNAVDSSLERLYLLVKKRLMSLPKKEAMRRLKAIDAAYSQGREPMRGL